MPVCSSIHNGYLLGPARERSACSSHLSRLPRSQIGERRLSELKTQWTKISRKQQLGGEGMIVCT